VTGRGLLIELLNVSRQVARMSTPWVGECWWKPRHLSAPDFCTKKAFDFRDPILVQAAAGAAQQ
jgi:hypothetical protein